MGHRLGLVTGKKYETFLHNRALLEQELGRLEKTVVQPGEALDALLQARGGDPLHAPASLAQLLRRPNVRYADLAPFDPARPAGMTPRLVTKLETCLLYTSRCRCGRPRG